MSTSLSFSEFDFWSCTKILRERLILSLKSLQSRIHEESIYVRAPLESSPICRRKSRDVFEHLGKVKKYIYTVDAFTTKKSLGQMSDVGNPKHS